MVNWQQIPKIDAHIHLLPDDVIAANRGCGDPFVEFGNVSDYLRLMDTYHIERAFVMPFNDPCMLSMDFTVESVHANLRDMAAGHREKLCCFADIDIRQGVERTVNELDRVLRQSEFVGIKLHPTNAGYPIDGEYYAAVFEYAQENGVLVEIHSYPREQLCDDVCSPGRIKNVQSRYPWLKLSIAHLGGLQFENWRGVNAYFNISAVLPDLVDRFGIKKTNGILRSFGVEKLIFATDYPASRSIRPQEIYDRYFDILNQMDFSQDEAECICKHNALRMIGAL